MAKTKVSEKAFIKLCEDNNLDITKIKQELKKKYPKYDARPSRILERIKRYRKKGLLPLDSGNYVSIGEQLTGTSTLFGPLGEIKQQWVKTDVPKQQFLEHFNQAIQDIVNEGIQPLAKVPTPKGNLEEENTTLYLSNDIHFGAYMWHEEVKKDWDIDKAVKIVKAAYDRLVKFSPPTKSAIVTDLGDLLEVDDYKNMTPTSGNILDVDGRYPKILRAAYETLIYGINRALEKHETVYFYNVTGNHDPSSGTAIREIIRMAFKDNPRVIVDDSPLPIKYHQHGTTLLQFAHGDGLKMKDSGEVMAHDCKDIFSSTDFRYGHFGHTHKDAVIDTRLCRAESHRNLPPLNYWAFSKGFRGPLGTMKSITYSMTDGEVSRQLYNVNMS